MRIFSMVVPRFTATLLLVFAITRTGAQVPGNANPAYFTIESYYKVKWGYAEEFIRLWKANHYPLLKKALDHGDVIRIKAETPRFHSGEDTRWDFRVTVVFRDVEKAFDEDLLTPYKKEAFPDLEALAKSEQHRFELLLAHWDVETAEQPLP
ncbi:MAG TPA: hypothetical protein VMH27_13190 [Puia sp.]|nr:hypothetical protein [Puia sp.]